MSNVNHKSAKQRITDRIKAGKIIGRVQKCALGLEEMTVTELNAARICLSKVVPDLKQTEFKGGLDLNATVTTIKRTIVEPEHTDS